MECYMCGRLPCRCWDDVELVRWRLIMRDVTPALRRLGWAWSDFRYVVSA